QYMSHWDAASYYITVLTAGHDTTSSSTAGALWALAERPDEFARLKANQQFIPALVDEAIRWTTPLIHFMRTATADYELRGQTIRKGDWLMLAYPSGNRDEEVFADPFAFKFDRTPNPHVSFGYGAHICLGQHLARMEMRIFFEELLPRLKEVELSGKPARTRSNFVGGVKTVPISYAMN
ncbi:MAG: cytochrome P450, partial [Hyphomonadaceae bacterium]